MTRAGLEEAHLAELHERAAEVGVPEYRKLPREKLIEEIAARGGESGAETSSEEGAEQAKPARRARSRSRSRSPKAPQRAPEPADEPTEEVAGILDPMPQGFGFLRVTGLESHPDDVYISASQIRRCELAIGDLVAGPARAPRRGERHRALVRVESVNGVEPGTERPEFDSLTPIAPHRRLPLDTDPEDLLTRAVDLLAPLALGQRVLVVSEPRSGRTTLLRGIARAIAASEAAPELIVLLADERPEEVTAWRRAAPDATIAAAAADLEPVAQVGIAELAAGRARRRAETGTDVVLLVDSLSRLAAAYRDPAEVKPFFGDGRELEEEGSGSMTVIATVFPTGAPGDGDALEALATTESAMLRLDPGLATKGIVPALVATECHTVGEEALREPAEMEAVGRLREMLAAVSAEEAAALLAERLRDASTNAELLERL